MKVFNFIKAKKEKLMVGEGKNFFTLFFGGSIATFVPLFLAPVLSRIYHPIDYGIVAVFMALINILNAFFNSHYNHSILIQRKVTNTVNAILLSNSINLIVSIALFFLLVFFPKIISFVSGENIIFSKFIYLIPIVVFLNGFNSSMGSWYQKNANYKTISSLNIIYSLSSIGFQILYAVIAPHILNVHPDYRGLLGGYFFSTFLTTVISLLFYLKQYWKFKRLASFKRIKEILKIEKKFFLISLPNDLMQTASNELPTLFLSKTITVYEVGNIGYARRFLGIPLTIGSNAISQIFSRKAIEEIHKNDNCRGLFLKTALLSTLIGFIPFLMLLFFGPQLFAFVFGEKWFLAGQFAQILGFYYYLNFIVGPLTYVYFIRKRLLEDVVIHLYLILSSLGSLYIGYLIFETSKGMLFLFTVNYSLVYIYYFIRSYFLSLTPEEVEK